ncbi:hypothetical protein DPMN_136918 [Dreissena polymorpha]|uniref:Uncharacterized protein n=1 Tax=Dreissena polymorpha TaxID=45954 RepID=A0A9D4G1M9_DREPO|nr:hypothetical protein DPMN_136918 [Dreissena polymorpha]
MPAESRFSQVHWKTGALPGRHRHIGAPPGHFRRRPRLNRGVAVALPGSVARIAPVSLGGVTVDRGFAGTLPAFTGAPSGRQPGHCRGFTGINRSLFGVDRDFATFRFNNDEYLLICTQLTFTCAYIRSCLHYRARGTLSMCIESIY